MVDYAWFPMLSLVVCHVLAIPVSTIAFESTFSTTCRVLDPFVPKMVETLIYTQNWIRYSSTPISLWGAMEDIEEFEKLNLGLHGFLLCTFVIVISPFRAYMCFLVL